MLKRHHAPVALVVTALGTIVLSIIVSIERERERERACRSSPTSAAKPASQQAVGMSLSGAGVAVVAVPSQPGIVRDRPTDLGLQPTCATHVLVVIMVIAGVNLAVVAITDHRRYWSVHMPAQAGIIVHSL